MYAFTLQALIHYANSHMLEIDISCDKNKITPKVVEKLKKKNCAVSFRIFEPKSVLLFSRPFSFQYSLRVEDNILFVRAWESNINFKQ